MAKILQLFNSFGLIDCNLGEMNNFNNVYSIFLLKIRLGKIRCFLKEKKIWETTIYPINI
jgi:hypothetical protein